ncbi:hypothetical protein ACIHDR_24930 [Nocardia sp. NPDC052278]|uniref:hypothetical protein n=1 Tax=unclassified Nocardia TaxID=2637762 RepID=UPI0036A45F2E
MNQSTHSAVANSTWSTLRHGPRGLISSVLYFPRGYDYAACRSGGQGLDGFREWLLTNHLGRESNLGWSGVIEQIALPDWDFVTELSREQEIRILEVLFDLLDKFLTERESLA